MARWNYFHENESNKKLAMISQPMNGKTNTEIHIQQARIIDILHSKGYEVIDTFIKSEITNSEIKHPEVYLLGESLNQMSKVDCVYFAKDWEKYRGCRIEHETAKLYNLEMIEE